MVRLTRFFAAHRHPRLAALISVVLSAGVFGGALLVDFPVLGSLVSPTFFVLIALAIFGASFMPLLKAVLGRRVEYGFGWFTPLGIVCILASVFVHPAAVVLVAVVNTVTLRAIHKPVERTACITFAGFLVPYTTAGLIVQQLTTSATNPIVWVCVLALAVVVGEVLNWLVVFPLSAMVNGEVRVIHINRTTIKPIVVLSAITVVVAAMCYFYDIVMATGVLVGAAAIAYFADQAIRNHQNFLGMRSLSWGVTATTLNFMSKLDDRTYRHSLSAARYTRDALRKWGFPTAVQDLGYMAGLLHQAGLTGVAKRLRIAEEEFTRDDLAPAPLPGEKTFDWNDVQRGEPVDPFQHVMAEAQDAAERSEQHDDLPESFAGEGSCADGEKEPAWWRPQEGKCLLSAHDIMTLDLYPAQTALLLEGASAYGGLPDIIAQHKKTADNHRFTHQDPRIASCVASMLKIAVRYEYLTAIDGSFPQKTPEVAMNMLRECEEEFDPRALHAFLAMMEERPANYRNGTDLDYENPNEQLIEVFAAEVPGPFDVRGWERYGKIRQQQVDAEKAFLIQFAKDYLNHVAAQREQGEENPNIQ